MSLNSGSATAPSRPATISLLAKKKRIRGGYKAHCTKLISEVKQVSESDDRNLFKLVHLAVALKGKLTVLRSIDDEIFNARVTISNKASPTLVMSQSRVAPLSRLTIPRLEVLSCLILARLVTALKDMLSSLTEVEVACCFTDSISALYWIKGAFQKQSISRDTALTTSRYNQQR